MYKDGLSEDAFRPFKSEKEMQDEISGGAVHWDTADWWLDHLDDDFVILAELENPVVLFDGLGDPDSCRTYFESVYDAKAFAREIRFQHPKNENFGDLFFLYDSIWDMEDGVVKECL